MTNDEIEELTDRDSDALLEFYRDSKQALHADNGVWFEVETDKLSLDGQFTLDELKAVVTLWERYAKTAKGIWAQGEAQP